MSQLFDWLRPKIDQAAALAKDLDIGWSSHFEDPAPSSRIEACERSIGMRLSRSHREFLSLHDGGAMSLVYDTIPRSWIPAADVTILGCTDIIELTLQSRNQLDGLRGLPLSTDAFGPFLVMAKYGGCGDLCIASEPRPETDEAVIADAFNECPDEWGDDVIASSFETWLRRIFDSFVEDRRILEYWMELSVVEMRDYARRDDKFTDRSG